MKSCALLMSRYKAQHLPSDLAKAEERDKSNGKSNEELFAEIFVTLAENDISSLWGDRSV